jgi:hypothetical protein
MDSLIHAFNASLSLLEPSTIRVRCTINSKSNSQIDKKAHLIAIKLPDFIIRLCI